MSVKSTQVGVFPLVKVQSYKNGRPFEGSLLAMHYSCVPVKEINDMALRHLQDSSRQ